MKKIFLLFSGLFIGFGLFAQDTLIRVEPAPSLFETLRSRENITVILDTDWSRIIRNKMKEEYQPSQVSILSGNDTLVNLEAQVATRGVMRKQVCFFPPLRIKFDKEDLAALGFKGHHVLKLVMQCNSGRSAVNLAEKELSAYGLFNILSPYSFRASPMQLIILNKGKNKENNIFSGFLIEPEQELAARLNAALVKRETCNIYTLERGLFNKMAVFEFMIGNTDWAVPNLHNLKVFKLEEYKKLVPVPYDFDYSGLVNAHYAVPFEGLNLANVRERKYRGFSCSEAEIQAIAAEFLAKKAALLAYCEQFPWSTDQTAEETRGYLEAFFEILEDPKQVSYVFGNGIDNRE